jgi:membrane protein
MDVQKRIRRIDAFQQGRPWLAFPFAVVKKFGDDQAGNLAALIAYYGFFSLFPLLLAFVAVLGLVLKNNPDLRQEILDSALAQFPVIGSDLQENIGALPSSGVAVTLGMAGAIWAGLGVTQSAQYAMNQIWDVPMRIRPSFLEKRIRGLMILAILAIIILASAAMTALGSAAGTFSIPLRLAGFAGSLLLNLALFLLVFGILTDRSVRWRDVFPGAAVAAVLWLILQAVGGWYISRQVTNAENVYGTFALVIGLLVWIYLGAQMTLLTAEINVVLARHLWPRSLIQPPLARADKRTYRDAARVEERVPQERVHVHFEDQAPPTGTEPPMKEDARLASSPSQLSTLQLIRSIVAGLADLVRKEIELAKQEVTEGLRAPVPGAAALAIAAVLGVLAMVFLGQAATTALDGVLPTWAARLVVGGALLVLIVGAVIVAVRLGRRSPLVPPLARRTARDSLDWAKRRLRHPAGLGSTEGKASVATSVRGDSRRLPPGSP